MNELEAVWLGKSEDAGETVASATVVAESEAQLEALSDSVSVELVTPVTDAVKLSEREPMPTMLEVGTASTHIVYVFVACTVTVLVVVMGNFLSSIIFEWSRALPQTTDPYRLASTDVVSTLNVGRREMSVAKCIMMGIDFM
jgi:hypothetical protein